MAIESGFSDQSHLTRALKCRTGLTPGELRVLMRSGRATQNDVPVVRGDGAFIGT
ncbi:MAG: hypothetical protein R3E12_02215 [Candidatus Eisenbacteria bacterium]